MSAHKRALIVDDSSISRPMLKDLPRAPRPDREAWQAGSGAEALLRVREVPPDLITLDLNMPGMDRLEAARLLHDACPDAKIAIVAAHIRDRVRRKVQPLGILSGAMAEKPINQAGVRKILFGL
ncbi:response regulator transcription factor [Chitinimonas koreensis]|uniref:response regulator transcription factor n=1 Tax=Chitinimonas koreensis TaxID=356302 RepID=UPI0004065294|nr:response regulator [Chitinimonas koreensis]